jgi:peroxiredoxin
MKRTIALLSLLPLLAFAATPALAQSGGKKPPPPPPPKKTDPKPPEKKPEAHKTGVGSEVDGAISLNDASGKTHALKDYRGKVVVLEFWSMDAASEAYTKKVNTLAEDLGKKGVVFLAIDASQADQSGSDADAAKKIADYAQKNGIAFPILLDKGGAVAHKLGAKSMPEVFVVDAKGIVRYTGAIDDDPKGEKADKANHYLRSAAEAVMAGKEVATATTTANGTPIQHEKAPEPPAKPGTPPPKK